MHIIWNKIRALIDWLAAVDAVAETNPSLVCWSDLPPYHPATDNVPDVHTGFIGAGR
jgi:hypothetical protein